MQHHPLARRGALAALALISLATLAPGLPASQAAENNTIWLDEMNLALAVSGFGNCQSKKTVDNKPLTPRGKV